MKPNKIDLLLVGKAILNFCNLLDRGNKLSLTNISLVIVLTKLAMAPFDFAGAAILLPILGSYMHKRYESNKQDKEAKALELQANNEITAKLDKISADHEEVVKTLADTRKLLSNSNLAAGFMPKR